MVILNVCLFSESNAEYVISLRASNSAGLGPAVYGTVRTRPAAGEGDDLDEPGDGDDGGDDEEEDSDPAPLIPPVGLKVRERFVRRGVGEACFRGGATSKRSSSATIVNYIFYGISGYNAERYHCSRVLDRPHSAQRTGNKRGLYVQN